MSSHWLWRAELSFPCPLAVIFNVSTCIPVREHDSNLCNGHRQDVPSRRCCGEHRRSSRVITANSRWQCSGLRCGRSSDSIAEETDSSPDPEEERQQHSCSSLLSISLTSEFAHTTSLSQSSLFFFWRHELPRERNFPRFDWPLNACVGFWRLEPELSQTAQNASMRRCHPPFFLFHHPLLACMTSRGPDSCARGPCAIDCSRILARWPRPTASTGTLGQTRGCRK